MAQDQTKRILKYALLGLTFIVIPGSSLILVGYGIRKLIQRRR